LVLHGIGGEASSQIFSRAIKIYGVEENVNDTPTAAALDDA